MTARIDEPVPAFRLMSVSAKDHQPRTLSAEDYAGRWLVIIFYPWDFSFVCPTELTAFSARLAEFTRRGCDLLGISVDSVDLHREWLTTPVDQGGLGPLQFPLASDPQGEAARGFGVWNEERRVSTRGLFIIDPAGVLQYSVVHNLSVGRNPEEILRVLDALQSGGLCPASWTAADGTIDPERALQPGRMLGHYRIRAPLGSGTFGAVFSAWDLWLERTVAIKVLKRALFESREALRAEARAAARLNHPHVCTVYSVEEVEGLPLIAMEYIDGRSLAALLDEAWEPDAAPDLARQIAAGLAAAHAQGVVHGDLKPANVMVAKDGTAKLLDFGLSLSQNIERAVAQRLAAETAAGLDIAINRAGTDATVEYDELSWEQGAIRGTPAYMSPEQARGLPGTPASDVFSFGRTFFEMLTGRRALVENSAVRLFLRLESEALASRLAQQLEAPYRQLMLELLAREPEQRPAMSEVVEQLVALR